MNFLNTPAEIVAALLVEGSDARFVPAVAGEDTPWSLYVFRMPDGDGVAQNVGAVYDTAGRVTGRLQKSGVYIEGYGIQIKTRSMETREGYNLLHDVSKQLAAVHLRTVAVGGNSYKIDAFVKASPVLSLGQDEKLRALLTVNFLVYFLT